ncbi:MAG TPA: LCP family protein [Candidatus Dojkabacteria bacterium]|jgi:anionic cell wall polymer biosynthesis LytR-Cps2A-Psr (LCP) family protein|nr:LCP family protein [Candidatus Dojkabacteria bacterium]
MLFDNLINKIRRKRVSSNFRNRFKREDDLAVTARISDFFKSKSRLGIVFIVTLIIIAIVTLFIRNVYSILTFEPQAFTETNLEIQNNWNGSDKMTILLIGTDTTSTNHKFVDHLSIYSLDPRENILSIFILNPDIKVTQATIGYTLNYRTIMNNRSIEGDKIETLIKSVENLLALKIDRYILADKNTFANFSSFLNPIQVYVPRDIKDEDTLNLVNSFKAEWGKGQNMILPANYLEFAASDNNGRDDQLERQQYLIESMTLNIIGFRSLIYLPEALDSFQNNIYTNMGKWELFNFASKLINLKDEDIRKGFLRESAYDKVLDIGFYEAVSPDISAIDKDINNIFFDMKVFKEQARIEVLNGSNISGLATNRKRWIENIGGRVIHKGNSYEKEQDTKIYCADPEKYTVTITELKRFLGSSVQLIEKEYPNRHVGEIVIVLGSNL